MVKKPATPPPSDDEPRYLTVVYPYPASAYMLESDVKQMAFWLACITKPQNLWAIYHKPSARNMIIIEVARNFQGFRELLGEHKWSQFLRNPSDDEKTKSSKIFYCTLGSGREVQKEGWKKTDIQDAWFTRGWTPINKIIEHPYPLSSRCDPPTEDITNKPFCRPLPVALFPPENMPPPIPVGSPEWIEAKQGPPGSAAWTAAKTGSGKAKSAGGAWGKGAPALVIPNRGGGGTRVSPSPAVATSSPAVNSSKSPSVNPWPAIGGSKSPSVQSGWSARSPGSAVSSTSPFVPPVMGAPWNPTSPPGIQSPASSCLSPSFDFDGPPGLVRSNTNSGTSSSSQQSASSDDDNERSNHGSSVIAPTPSVAAPGAVEFMEEMYTSMSDLAVADYAPDWEIQSVVTATHSDSVSSYQQDDADEEASLWDDHATNGSKPSDDVIACPHHGKECTKGICSWRSDLERKKAKEKRATEAKQNANTKRGRGANNNGHFGGRGRGRGRGRGNFDGNTNGTARSGPPPSTNNSRNVWTKDATTSPSSVMRTPSSKQSEGNAGGWDTASEGPWPGSSGNGWAEPEPQHQRQSTVTRANTHVTNSVPPSSNHSDAGGWDTASNGPWGPTPGGPQPSRNNYNGSRQNEPAQSRNGGPESVAAKSTGRGRSRAGSVAAESTGGWSHASDGFW